MGRGIKLRLSVNNYPMKGGESQMTELMKKMLTDKNARTAKEIKKMAVKNQGNFEPWTVA